MSLEKLVSLCTAFRSLGLDLEKEEQEKLIQKELNKTMNYCLTNPDLPLYDIEFLVNDKNVLIFHVHWFENQYIVCNSIFKICCQLCQQGLETKLRAMLLIATLEGKEEIIHLPISLLNFFTSMIGKFHDYDTTVFKFSKPRNIYSSLDIQLLFKNKNHIWKNEDCIKNVKNNLFNATLATNTSNINLDIKKYSLVIGKEDYWIVPPTIFKILDYERHKIGDTWNISFKEFQDIDWNQITLCKGAVPDDAINDFSYPIYRKTFHLIPLVDAKNIRNRNCKRRLSHLCCNSFFGSDCFNVTELSFIDWYNRHYKNINLTCSITSQTVTMKKI